jgi:hypothetical protein
VTRFADVPVASLVRRSSRPTAVACSSTPGFVPLAKPHEVIARRSKRQFLGAFLIRRI